MAPIVAHKVINGEDYCVDADGRIWRTRDGQLMERSLDGTLSEYKPRESADEFPEFLDILDADLIGEA